MLRGPIDATIILVIVLVSGFLGIWQERGAVNAVEKLYAIVQINPERRKGYRLTKSRERNIL